MSSAVSNNEPLVPGAPVPFGRFYLQERINSGGMADIWLATDSNGKAYALRRLHDRLRYSRREHEWVIERLAP